MESLISMLRGINVSGQKKVSMPELKKAYEHLKFKNVSTYINSGNVIFSSDISDLKIFSEKIENSILKTFGFEVPVIIRTVKEMQSVVRNNPMLKEKNIDTDKLHVTFLSETPVKAHIVKMQEYNFSPDIFIIRGREVYLFCPNGYGRTKLTNNYFENKLKMKATTRNWKTVNELIKIAYANPA